MLHNHVMSRKKCLLITGLGEHPFTCLITRTRIGHEILMTHNKHRLILQLARLSSVIFPAPLSSLSLWNQAKLGKNKNIKLLEHSGRQQCFMCVERQRDVKELSLSAQWKHVPGERRTYPQRGPPPAEGTAARSGKNPGSGLCAVIPWGRVEAEFWTVSAECPHPSPPVKILPV